MKKCLATMLAATLAACGGDNGGNASPAPPKTYTVGGTVSGLNSAGLVLANGTATAQPDARTTQFTLSPAVATGTT